MKGLQHTDYEMFLVASPDEEATNAFRAVDNGRARVALGGEGARLVVKEKDGPLLGESEVVFVVVIVVDTKERLSLARPIVKPVVLPCDEAGVAILVEHGWIAHFIGGDGAIGLQETVHRYSKPVGLVGLGRIIRVKSWA